MELEKLWIAYINIASHEITYDGLVMFIKKYWMNLTIDGSRGRGRHKRAGLILSKGR